MIYPASVTPFTASGAVDLPGLARLIAWFRSCGCDGVVMAGTNGEGPSLAVMERRDLVRAAVDLAEGLPVMLGVATQSLSDAIWLCSQAMKAGAEAVLVMPPSFFPADPDGIAAWYEKVMDESGAPVLLYDFPQRTHLTFQDETIRRLSAHPLMIGIKDSSADVTHLARYSALIPGKKLLVGDETLLIKALEAGWTGSISGAANVLGGWLSVIRREWETDRESALVKFELVLPLIQALRSSPQPLTNKYCLQRHGIVERADVRLPLSSAAGERTFAAWETVKPLLS